MIDSQKFAELEAKMGSLKSDIIDLMARAESLDENDEDRETILGMLKSMEETLAATREKIAKATRPLRPGDRIMVYSFSGWLPATVQAAPPLDGRIPFAYTRSSKHRGPPGSVQYARLKNVRRLK